MGANDKVAATFHPWHDEADRFERTGRLDAGPCLCAECSPHQGDTPTS